MEECLSEEGIVFFGAMTGAVSGLSGEGGWGNRYCRYPIFVQERDCGDAGDCGYVHPPLNQVRVSRTIFS